MTTAVVILNWNGKALLEQFLPTVVQYSEGATVYVADNASTDDSLAYVSAHFPTVQIIKNTENGGYAKGYNDALANLSEEIFVLLNSDVAVTENWLAPVLSAFKNDDQLVAAQPKILDFNKKTHFEYAGAAGGFVDKLGYPYCRGRIFNTLEEDQGQYNDTTTIFWASGACLFVSSHAFRAVGGLDADFFAHQEEIDLCWRLQAKGGIVKYVGASTVFHVGGATLGAANAQKTFYNFRNTLLMLVKNVKGSVVWWRIFQRLVLDAVAGIQFLLQGKGNHFFAILRAHFSFYALLPKFLRKRKNWASNLKYSEINSVVIAYFLKGKKYYNQLK
ncbi:MAG TPA: glycosyltransferase family 2 protein [Flavobacteriaceae bacterium]|nr:dTDP-Rha--alpha-D-GlcNAc-pyrophosphate polyprenol alpha-3-L-rhamnosyltransferase [Flavobacteriaceae bacterium]HIB48606.1 glycosyltransferase family 2 protein [Flavobacteriaceae bacterium]HIN97950.1 glycosyltransferase family 2 protein [Flavobacteriaceae bacterium]|tara:strand:+ start:546 stop:1541 length:996 start_codon:yes stop_codon:yes gene_type:complete